MGLSNSGHLGRDSPPQEVLDYLDDRLAEIEEDAPSDDADFARKLLRKLGRLAKVPDDSDIGYRLVCPCCDREMNRDETGVFKAKLEALKQDSALVKTSSAEVDEYNNMKASYEKWRKSMSSKMDDLRDHKRLREERANLELALDTARDDLERHQGQLQEEQATASTLRSEVEELRDLLDHVRRWSTDAARISEKRMQIGQKRQDMTLDTALHGRDLRSVERRNCRKDGRKGFPHEQDCSTQQGNDKVRVLCHWR